MPINLNDREFHQFSAELAQTIVADKKVMFNITYPFTTALRKQIQKATPWTLNEVLQTFHIFYTIAYAQDDVERVHELIIECGCSTVLNETAFQFTRMDDTSCRICLSTRMSNKLTLSCGHLFHARCIRDWFKEKNACPLCQEPIIPCDNCHSKRTIELSITDNQLRQASGQPRVPTQGPFGIGAYHYEELYFTGLQLTEFEDNCIEATLTALS